MPNLKSSKKQLHKSIQRRHRNRGVMSVMRTAIKRVRQASDSGSGQAALVAAISIIDRTAKKGVIHARTAARYKSRLTAAVRRMA